MSNAAAFTERTPNTAGRWLPALLVPLLAVAGPHFAVFYSPLRSISHVIDLPSGTGLAVILLLGWRALPTTFAAMVAIQMSLNVRFFTALQLGGMETLAPAIAAVLLIKVAGFRNALTRQRDLVALLLIGAGLLPLLSGLFWGLAYGLLNGAWAMFETVLKMVWFTHASGVLTLAPAVLCLGTRKDRPPLRDRHPVQLSIIVTAATASACIAWCDPFDFGEATTALAFLPIAFPIWAALRFGHYGAISVTALIVFIAAWGTTSGSGMFSSSATHSSDSLLFSLIAICSSGSLLAAIIIFERNIADIERRSLEVRVRQAEKLESLGMLAGGVAHDFNNLLTPILAGADLLAHGEATEANKELLANIKSASLQARGLCQQMLAYAGRAGIEREVIDLGNLVRDTEPLVRHIATSGITVAFEYTRSRTIIEVDVSQIQQVLLNLAKNGAEAMADDGGRMTVAVRVIDANEAFLDQLHRSKQLAPGTYVGLEVEDHGTGIAEADIERVFDPFYSTKGDSRGLGLAGVIGITQAHNGGIAIDSSEGAGTRITAWFPRSKRALTDRAETPRPSPGTVNGTVMVVDDDPKVRFAARSVLERSGMTVVEATSGEAAIEVASDPDAALDLVLLDLTMPGIDGHETFSQLQAVRPDVPVILSSGYDKNRNEASLTQRGYAAFLQKPYESSSLLSRVQDALTASKNGSPPA